MPVTVTTNFDPDEIRFSNPEIMRQVGLMARETIKRRTARGISADGTPFRRYSPGYAKAKGALGGASVVNLTVTGAMLNALQVVEATDNSVTLGFS